MATATTGRCSWDLTSLPRILRRGLDGFTMTGEACHANQRFGHQNSTGRRRLGLEGHWRPPVDFCRTCQNNLGKVFNGGCFLSPIHVTIRQIDDLTAMATYNGPLTRAPAREALIDIQFAPAVSEATIKTFTDRRLPHFDKSSPVWQTMFGLSVTPDGPAHQAPSSTSIGIRLESAKPPHVLQSRGQGFTFSRLSPYGSWDELRAAAKAEWDIFVSVAPKFTANRIAVRYINELKIPLPFGDFAEYLSSSPNIPEGLPQAVSSFLQRFVIPDPDMDCVSIVTQVLEEVGNLEGNTVTVLLDIDVFRSVQIESTDSGQIWQQLDALRVQKNRMFFGHITDKMVDLLK